MFAHPKDKARIFPVPTAPSVPPEERPRLFVVLVTHQHPHSPRFTTIPGACTSSPKDRGGGDRRRSAAAFVFLPDDAEEERAGTVHDCYVRKFPIPIVRYERFDYKGEERVVGDGAHGVVGDAGGIRAADPGWVGKKRVEAAVATL